MKPRCFLGLAFSLLATSPLAGWAATTLPPLEGEGATPPSPPPEAPAAEAPAATAPAQAAPTTPAPTEAPAATAPAPSEPPPPVHEVESDFPEPDAPAAANDNGGYEDELEPVAPPTKTTDPLARRPWEISVGLGIGNAFCDRDAPDSDCPVAGGFAFFVGGGYRFVPNFSAGVELAGWSYAVREGWRGGLSEDPDDVQFTSSYLAAYGRWYWFKEGKMDPYLQAGIGLGSLVGKAETETDTFEVRSNGLVVPVGIGVDWQLGRIFRLGPQALVYWHHATEICTKTNDDDEQCHDPGRNEDGDREGEAIPWRIAVTGTFTLGSR